MKTYNIIILAKQVPDTRNVGKDAMKADGTINRAALPAIFNPKTLMRLNRLCASKIISGLNSPYFNIGTRACR